MLSCHMTRSCHNDFGGNHRYLKAMLLTPTTLAYGRSRTCRERTRFGIIDITFVNMGEALDRGLEGFLPGVHRYPYKGKDDFPNVMNYELTLPDRREFFLVTNLSQHTFEADFFNTEDKPFSHSWKEYFYDSQLLVVEMLPRVPHERASRRLSQFIMSVADANAQLSPDNLIIPDGTAAVQLGTSAKCPDESFRPLYFAHQAFPTVIVETAFTESPQKLEQDARRWVTQSNGQVTVITVHLEESTERIVLQRWVLANGSPVRRQETTITNVRGARRNEGASVQITNAPFIIPYQELLARAPRSSNDRDISIDVMALGLLCEQVWASQ
ncbi:uncharacterized protein N7443_001967 [Penicillium atrosanguineum]|uniref:uncharacterized protein n=1 Tax=Penicillium atrosanguineum TaxID=1132637 RepID=UPI00238E3512|nr:uncharacterized protein N7443_001967 [Penicillium atrosanguineum]KAJ5121860.1 hypothetical protein N7526_008797 [Penicillium atrosanguineum]KAJ5309506.1 hypothetical protein N7443_001967 [Penicillium atrosanguineum]